MKQGVIYTTSQPNMNRKHGQLYMVVCTLSFKIFHLVEIITTEARIIHQKVTDKRGPQQNHNLNSHKLKTGEEEYYFTV